MNNISALGLLVLVAASSVSSSQEGVSAEITRQRIFTPNSGDKVQAMEAPSQDPEMQSAILQAIGPMQSCKPQPTVRGLLLEGEGAKPSGACTGAGRKRERMLISAPAYLTQLLLAEPSVQLGCPTSLSFLATRYASPKDECLVAAVCKMSALWVPTGAMDTPLDALSHRSDMPRRAIPPSGSHKHFTASTTTVAQM
eukprot:jgi/Botrbrau1/15830/Bobra.40_1s0016.1